MWMFPASRLPPSFALPAEPPAEPQPSLPSAAPTRPRYEGRCHCTLDEKSCDGMLMAGKCFYYTRSLGPLQTWNSMWDLFSPTAGGEVKVLCYDDARAVSGLT